LGHGDYETQKYPTMISTIYNGVLDILAVGNSSVFLDDFNNIRTCGCNLQGQLGDDSVESYRNIPDKLGKQFLLHNILMFKGHYDEL
jgi:alpha-tubulin suppressor-like RCC1 family protein